MNRITLVQLMFVFLKVSEKAMDYKIWQTLFGREIPYKPTYLPNTRLARYQFYSMPVLCIINFWAVGGDKTYNMRHIVLFAIPISNGPRKKKLTLTP